MFVFPGFSQEVIIYPTLTTPFDYVCLENDLATSAWFLSFKQVLQRLVSGLNALVDTESV